MCAYILSQEVHIFNLEVENRKKREANFFAHISKGIGKVYQMINVASAWITGILLFVQIVEYDQ